MKATDLMLGDIIGYLPTWINDEDGTIQRDGDPNNPILCKVDGLGFDSAILTNGEDSFDVSDIELYPIPITPEILEKNGFKIVHHFGYPESYPTYGWGYHKELCDYAYVDITFYDEPIGGVSRLVRVETASKKDDGINSIHSCDIEFIHELQHAISVCKIEKEIII